MASISNATEHIQRRLASMFSHTFFDEAHHKEARTWKSFCEYSGTSKILLLTATPFREDGKPIGGKLIYNFPLHKAQEQGYFTPIRFIEVFEPDEARSDRAIAEAAVNQLRNDRAAGYHHLMMARADSISDATRLLAEIYHPLYSDLNPVLVHSGIPQKREVLGRILSQEHKIIICVDMLGEGFDLPELKIAALHSVHKSIGVTLQFIGRFTRTSDGLGPAAFVANLANDGVPDSLQELYQGDADWNLVVSDLSYDAVSPQERLSHLIDGLESLFSDEDFRIAPLTLRPMISAHTYRVDGFFPAQYAAAFRKEDRIVKAWRHREENFLAVVTTNVETVDWADTKDIRIDVWELHLFYYRHAKGLMFVNSSRKHGLPMRSIAKITENPDLIDGESVFRAFSGLHRLTLHNVGLTGRNRNVRYQMYAGMDVRNAITPIDEGDKLKCNVSGVGYEMGERVNVGCSRKGKVWSMASGSLADWQRWCDHIGDKLTNSEIRDRDFLKHTLIPDSIITLPPTDSARGILADWPDQLFQSQIFSFELEVGGRRFSFHQCELSLDEWDVPTNSCLFSIHADNHRRASLRLTLDPHAPSGFSISRVSTEPVNIIAGGTTFSADSYFEENPPLIRLSDGSQLSGNILLKPREQLGETFDRNAIAVFNWSAADITKESRWKNGAIRADSIQAVFMEFLKTDPEITHLIDDDDCGESADVVAIHENGDDIKVHFWHCKYSSGTDAGNRAKDLYEVCGQAQKCAKWTWSFDRLVKHLKIRETESNGGRVSRFLKGTYRSLHTLRRASRRKRIAFRIGIVQPGLAKSSMPDDHLAILGATNAFVSVITNASLLVYASA